MSPIVKSRIWELKFKGMSAEAATARALAEHKRAAQGVAARVAWGKP